MKHSKILRAFDAIKVKPQGGHDPLRVGTARRCYQEGDRARMIAEYRAMRQDNAPTPKPRKMSAKVWRNPERRVYATGSCGFRVYVPAQS